MLERIGQVVMTARNEAGRSREELAREAGIEAKALESLEEGKPGLTTTQLAAIARALLLDPLALLNGRREERPIPSVFLRHKPAQDFHDQDHAVLDEALEESRAFNRLRELLGRSALGIASNAFQTRETPTSSADAPARDGYKVAREARRWLNQTKEPLEDIRELIEARFGATVVLRKLASTKVTAATVRAGTAASIVLAASDWQRANNPLLARVILAHELCHALVDPLVGGLQIVLDESNDRKTNAAEQRARAFAAELLLPLDGLSTLLGPPLSTTEGDAASRMVATARSRFGTPHEIAVNHLCNLGFVNITLRERLEHDKTPFVGTTPPATSLPQSGEPSIAVREHVEAAHRDGLITDGEARAILGLDRLARLPWDPPTLLPIFSTRTSSPSSCRGLARRSWQPRPSSFHSRSLAKYETSCSLTLSEAAPRFPSGSARPASRSSARDLGSRGATSRSRTVSAPTLRGEGPHGRHGFGRRDHSRRAQAILVGRLARDAMT